MSSVATPAGGRQFLALGIETSCDDTAASVVDAMFEGGVLKSARALSSEVWSQYDRHAEFGGVVPEIAARSHVERVDAVMSRAIAAAGVTVAEIDLVAATAGPGLVGGVMVGLSAAKGFALANGVPLVPVNHLEGHALSARLTEDAAFPYLLLLVSGGHTQLIEVSGLGAYRRIGTTIDDAAGEAFDKTAKLLSLGQPGGPRIESAAVAGRADRFHMPRPLLNRQDCDFSFSGLKTAVRVIVEQEFAGGRLDGQAIADIAGGFQTAVAEHLAARTARAIANAAFENRLLVVAGGVAANCEIKGALARVAGEAGWRLAFPPPKYCTDNGAMIALAGAERFAAGLAPPMAEALAFAPKARWPLAPPIVGAEHGGGKKGPKA
ncbi:MAG: tRNA (adenosine(37)-N6)-threonylcarbamoyltransferase complex transferase subunit TsaD [Alphaproteobacteria bacterium]|nr:tRNA (adenosine(37)-N6)-threonylcarbamoyltransferase complex transferase subunit TsaD [Alphaproteobacteria bacterium]